MLQDEDISYTYNKGQEEVFINGLTIGEFLSTNTSAHEFIRKHTTTATRNFDQRVKSFIKTIVMNTFSPLCPREYSYRIEFQMRGNKINMVLIKRVDISEFALLQGPLMFTGSSSLMLLRSSSRIKKVDVTSSSIFSQLFRLSTMIAFQVRKRKRQWRRTLTCLLVVL